MPLPSDGEVKKYGQPTLQYGIERRGESQKRAPLHRANRDMATRRGIILTTLMIGWFLPWLALGHALPAPLANRPVSSWQEETAEQVLVGRLDEAAPQGLVLLSRTGSSSTPGVFSAFGVRILVYRPNEAIEETPTRVTPGLHTADGGIGSVSWATRFDPERPVTLRWSRPSPHLLLAQVSAPRGVRIALEAYRPWESGQESWVHFRARTDRRTLVGESVHPRGLPPPRRQFLLQTDRTAIGAASFRSGTSLRAQLMAEGHAQETPRPSESGVALPSPRSHAALSFDLSQDGTLSFVVLIGDQWARMEQEAKEAFLPGPIPEQLTRAEERARTNLTRSGGKWGESFEAIQRSVLASRRFDPGTGLLHLSFAQPPDVTATKSGPEAALPAAEAALYGSLIGTLLDPEAAKGTLRLLLSTQQPDGRVPLSAGGGNPPAVGRSLAPLASWIALKLYFMTQDLEFLAWSYPRLLQWNQWWHTNRSPGRGWRDGNGDGLLEWGGNTELEFGSLAIEALGLEERRRLASTEGGLTANTSPETPFDAANGTFQLTSISLNSLYALDTECLALLARELGLSLESERLFDRYQRLRTLINTRLWDEEQGLYVDQDWDGRRPARLTLACLYPMLAGIPEPDRAKRMMKHLAPLLGSADLQPNRSVGSYLVYQGLRRYREDQAAAELAGFLSADEPSSTMTPAPSPLPALRLWPTFEELLFPDPLGGLTLGSRTLTEERRLDAVGLRESRLDLLASPTRTLIRRDGKIELECEGPVRLYGYRRQDRTLSFLIETGQEVKVLVPGEEGRKTTVTVDQAILGSTSVGASASFRVPPGSHRVLIVR